MTLKKFQHYTIQELLDLMRNKDLAEVCKRLIKSKLLGNHQVDVYWSFDFDGFKECPDKIKMTKMNKIRRDGYSYTSKKGLCEASKKSWFHIPGLACMNHPRTYSLIRNGDTSDFIKDFSLTAAMSLLKWIMKNSISHESKIISPSGKIAISVFNFAINECYKFIKKSRKEERVVDKQFYNIPHTFVLKLVTILLYKGCSQMVAISYAIYGRSFGSFWVIPDS
ncbi:hypothetical protein NQ317_003135 [Molorchus minor]|uniref:Uncharacterized protein n=1 Tax=Molorchus minor TaxID=1323400 RepID=A0ABQ9JM81_9CUCU|nr:hypothetical protein NQ317_003135 [Molorchus minor]